jgi:hypothetical protein
VYGRTLTLSFSGGLGTILIVFDGAGKGNYTYSSGSPGVVDSYTWKQDAYRGRLQPIYYSGLVPMVLHLDFAAGASGSFSGTAYTSPSSPVSGTYTIAGP